MEWLGIACDIVILIGGVAAAILSILKLLGKPIHFFKKSIAQDEARRTEELTKSITAAVSHKLMPDLDEIKQQNMEQNETITVMLETTKDLLRKSIINIYNEHKYERCLTETDKEMLDDLYNDYRAEHGNSYIEKLYNRMSKWEIVPDEE